MAKRSNKTLYGFWPDPRQMILLGVLRGYKDLWRIRVGSRFFHLDFEGCGCVGGWKRW
ncbi:MAG: hypothetical protein K8G79_07440 [bacterium]|uniref:Uncharacterized protein n=1 Tax=Candidatus Methylomirabilis tolerans TaxID=3123416 RepID=A0AAJ1AKA1_9BACT|nr:hypothetical protein [Candidatus Methylomirabilis sp.]